MKYGGDDITEYWTRLLLRGSYPWAELDLAKSVDRRVLQAAKERWCTLFESDVAMQLGETVVRNRGQKTKKFSWRMYDETFLASLVFDHLIRANGRLYFYRQLWESLRRCRRDMVLFLEVLISTTAPLMIKRYLIPTFIFTYNSLVRKTQWLITGRYR
jgi:hypothetical protein